MSKLRLIEEKIKKEYGDIMIPADYLVTHPPKITSTTLGLDIALSGGLLEGRITTIAAPPGAGKTTLCLTMIANAQRQHKKRAYYMDMEHRLTKELLTTIPGLVWTDEQEKATGIPKLQIIRSTPEKFISAEDCLNILSTIFKEENNTINVLDSIAALCTTNLQGSQLGESRQMLRIPQYLYDFCRQVLPIISAKGHDLLFIAHMTSNPTGYGNPLKMTGGNAIEYFSSNVLYCFSSKEIEGPGEGAKKIGKNTTFKLKKSAMGAPNMEAVIPIRYGKGYDLNEDIILLAEQLGIISKGGAWYTFKHKDKEVKLQGSNAVYEYLNKNPDVAKSLENQVRKFYSELNQGADNVQKNSGSNKS